MKLKNVGELKSIWKRKQCQDALNLDKSRVFQYSKRLGQAQSLLRFQGKLKLS